MTTLAVTSVSSLRCQASTCLRMGSKLRCIRSTPTEMQSMSENDFECFVSTGVKSPETISQGTIFRWVVQLLAPGSEPEFRRNSIPGQSKIALSAESIRYLTRFIVSQLGENRLQGWIKCAIELVLTSHCVHHGWTWLYARCNVHCTLAGFLY